MADSRQVAACCSLLWCSHETPDRSVCVSLTSLKRMMLGWRSNLWLMTSLSMYLSTCRQGTATIVLLQ